jgi:hypothetical protein
MLYKVERADPGRITTFRKFEAQDRYRETLQGR